MYDGGIAKGVVLEVYIEYHCEEPVALVDGEGRRFILGYKTVSHNRS
jgi:hypothetical protein